MSYQPIENYGIIGNMRTAALVSLEGSIDWLCFPHFDSPSIFAALLDDNIGGRWQISVQHEQVTQKQFYWPDTNVLVTRYLTVDGVGEVTDYMPVGDELKDGRLIRSVSVLRGTLRFRMICEPAFNYARDAHQARIDPNGVVFHSDGLHVCVITAADLQRTDRGVRAEFTLKEGETLSFELRRAEAGEPCPPPLHEAQMDSLFRHTVSYWQRWLSRCSYTGRWREIVYRSALALKLMIFEPTGAIVAAPTTSLPEGIGGERNWDYRYTWLRDASFTIYALIRIGFTEEAAAFMRWIDARVHELEDADSPMQPLYTIHGGHHIPEETLSHLEGYRGSRPVRIGNAAASQLQLDIYGAVMDSAYLYNKYGSFLSYDLWTELRLLANWVCANWERKDLGIWEIRSEPKHMVYSKVMCWVALDRALRIADKRAFPSDWSRWQQTRDTIYEQVMAHGWNESIGAFTQAYDGDTLDAANLIMPLTFFVSPNDERFQRTLAAMTRPLESGGLMSGDMLYRYDVRRSPDGLSGEEGTFNMCTFWLVEALTRAGKTEQAMLIFERMLGYGNHLGLYAEQTGLAGEALGNFPQAFTHLALISAAFNLDRALYKGKS